MGFATNFNRGGQHMRPQRRTAIQMRRVFLASLAVLAAGLGTVGAVAYACTGVGVNEFTYSTPSSGTGNLPLSVQTWTGGAGLDKTKNFFFRYAPPNDATTCAAKPAVPNYPSVKPNASGHIGSSSSKIPRTIPNLGSPGGTGEACWSTGTAVPSEIAAPALITVN